jgi:transposase InsO family protein
VLELRRKYPLKGLLKISDISRSSYYFLINENPDKDAEIKRLISEINYKHKGRYGYRRIMQELKSQGMVINHKKVQRLMGVLGLKSMIRIKKYKSYHGNVGKIAPNLLNRNFHADKPNQKWATDITEFALFGQKIYLSTIIDLFNGKIVCYHLHNHPTYHLVHEMLQKAKTLMLENKGLILHSDQGWHCQMRQYQAFLRGHGVVQSMSRKGNCLDNAVQENFFGLLKSEFLYLQKFDSLEQFTSELHVYISYYNIGYYLHNSHGDVVALTNNLGTITKTYQYDANWNEKNKISSDKNPFRYAGEYYDPALLIY